MDINRNLNLVMNIGVDGENFIIHSTPISKAIFDLNWRYFREVYDDLSRGSIMGSLALAKNILIDAATTPKNKNAAHELINAISANTFVILPAGNLLITNDAVDSDLRDEVINRLIFFTVYNRHLLASNLTNFMEAMASVMNGEFTLLNATEYANSLTTSTTVGNIGVNQIPS